jgi:hypothetical protein
LYLLITAERTGISALKDIVNVADNQFPKSRVGPIRDEERCDEDMNSAIQAVKRRAKEYKDWRNLCRVYDLVLRVVLILCPGITW